MPERISGGIGRLIAERDWSQSPLGPPRQWPSELRDAVRLILPAEVQIVMFWGPEYVALYNDAYAPTIGDKHPGAFGTPAREHWAELWDDLEPLLRQVRETGQTHAAKDRPFYIERHGYGEEVYFDISYSPVRDDAGAVMGVLCIVDETTARVAYRAQLQFQLDLADRLRGLSDPEAVMAAAAELLGQRLAVDRAGYVEVDAEEHFTVTSDWATGALPPLVGRYRIAAFGQGILDTLRAGHTLTIDDAHADPRTTPVLGAFDAIGLKAAVAAPLIRGGRIVAILHLHSARPRRWTETEIALVEAAAERTWAAVEQVKAEAILAASEAALREESHALEVLNATAMRVAAEFDLDRLVQTVVDAGVEVSGAHFGSFFYNVIDGQGESYMLYALSGVDKAAFENFPMPRNTKVFAPTFAGEGTVRSDDITRDPRFGRNPPYNGRPKGHLPVRSYLAAPVVSRTGAAR